MLISTPHHLLTQSFDTASKQPNSRQVSSAIARTSNTKGTLVVVKNYTGDVLQFGLAKERYAATHPGKDDIRFLIVGDDVA